MVLSASSSSSSTTTSGINLPEAEESLQSSESDFGTKKFSDYDQSQAQKHENQSLPSPNTRLPSSAIASTTLAETRNGGETRTLHRYALQDFSSRALRQNHSCRSSHHQHPNTITCRPISDTSSIAQSSLSSSSSSLETDPLSPTCKICHLNAKDGDPLISPCKCSGTMQYIHCGCLMVCHFTVICIVLIVHSPRNG